MVLTQSSHGFNKPPRHTHVDARPASSEVRMRRSHERGYPYAKLNSISLDRASGFMKGNS